MIPQLVSRHEQSNWLGPLAVAEGGGVEGCGIARKHPIQLRDVALSLIHSPIFAPRLSCWSRGPCRAGLSLRLSLSERPLRHPNGGFRFLTFLLTALPNTAVGGAACLAESPSRVVARHVRNPEALASGSGRLLHFFLLHFFYLPVRLRLALYGLRICFHQGSTGSLSQSRASRQHTAPQQNVTASA